MRLLFVLPEYPPHHGGGIATFYEALLPALVEQGHTVEVVLGSAFVSGGDPYEHRGVRVRYLDADRTGDWMASFQHYEMMPELRRSLAAAWAIHEQVEAGEGYDLVEVVDWGLLFAPWMVDRQAPVVVQLHGSSGQIDARVPNPSALAQGHLTRLIEAGLLRGADGLHTHSAMNVNEWETVAGRPVEYFPPPLDLVAETENVQQRSDGGLVVGRVQYWKGPTVLCEALQALGPDAPRIEWVGRDMAYGEEPSMRDYLRRTYPSVWDEHITPVGLRSPEDVARMQASAAFVIVPSVWDVYNLTAVEAMRHGAVVICSTGAGAVDLIEDGVNGFSFPVGDASSLAAAIRRVRALSAAERNAISEAARATVVDRLAPQTVAAQKVQAFESVLGTDTGREPDPWAVLAARPERAAPASLSFLDHQPLRDLLSYTLRRVREKLPGPFGS